MQLPAVPTPVAFWLSSDGSIVNMEGAKVRYILDKHAGRSVGQASPAAQPSLESSGINRRPTLLFSGSQYLTNAATGAVIGNNDFTLFLVSSSSDIAGSVTKAISLDNTTGNTQMSLGFGGGNVEMALTNAAGSAVAPTASDNGSVHVYTLMRQGTTFTLRRDGVNIITQSGSGTYSPDNITIGGTSAGGTFASGFKGRIKHAVLYRGTVTLRKEIEQFLLVDAGLSTVIS